MGPAFATPSRGMNEEPFGFRIGKVWFVSVVDLPALEISRPSGFLGSLNLEIGFFRDSNSGAVEEALIEIIFSVPGRSEADGGHSRSLGDATSTEPARGTAPD